MKKRKLILDIIMTAIFLSLLNLSFTTLAVHEWLGLGILFLILIHNVFNIKWIKGVTKKFFSPDTKVKTKIQYVLDLTLFLLFAFIVLSGIFISQEIFPWINVGNGVMWSNLHHFAAYSALVLMSVHIGLNWQMIMNAFKKLLHLKAVSTARTYVVRTLAMAIAIIGVYGLTRPTVYTNFTAPFVAEDYLDSYSTSDNQDALAAQTVSEYLATSSQSASAINTAVLKADSTSTLKLQNATASINASATADNVSTTLNDYLGNLHCTGCGKHCSLLSPQCGKGAAQAQSATAEFEAANSSSSSSQAASSEASSSQSQQAASETPSSSSSSSQKIEETPSSSEAASSETSSITSSSSQSAEAPSLNEYLGKLYCTGCGKHCSLLTPQCNKGVAQAESATTEYNELYASAAASSSSSASSSQSSSSSSSSSQSAEETAPTAAAGNSSENTASVAQDNNALKLFRVFSIAGLFTVLTYYISKIFNRKKKVNEVNRYR